MPGTDAASGDDSVLPDAPPDATAAGIAFLQAAAADIGSATTGSVPFAQPVRAGSTIIVAIGTTTGTLPSLVSVSDRLGATFVISGPYNAPNLRGYLAYGHVTTGGPDLVDLAATGPHTSLEVRVLEYAGIDTVDPFDGSVGTSGTDNSLDGARSAQISCDVPGELVFGFLIFAGTGIGGTGFTTRSSAFGDVIEDRLSPGTGLCSATGTQTTGAGWIAILAQFRPA